MAKPKGGASPKKGKKNRKFGRTLRKNMNRSKPISLFVRNVITASQYFVMTGQKIKLRG